MLKNTLTNTKKVSVSTQLPPGAKCIMDKITVTNANTNDAN